LSPGLRGFSFNITASSSVISFKEQRGSAREIPTHFWKRRAAVIGPQKEKDWETEEQAQKKEEARKKEEERVHEEAWAAEKVQIAERRRREEKGEEEASCASSIGG